MEPDKQITLEERIHRALLAAKGLGGAMAMIGAASVPLLHFFEPNPATPIFDFLADYHLIQRHLGSTEAFFLDVVYGAVSFGAISALIGFVIGFLQPYPKYYPTPGCTNTGCAHYNKEAGGCGYNGPGNPKCLSHDSESD